jgi:hypothetical protein
MHITGRSFFSAVVGLAFAAFTITSAGATVVISYATTGCSWAFERAVKFLKDASAKFTQPSLVLVRHGAEKVQACAYALSIAKRERPQVRSQWRMCPSI